MGTRAGTLLDALHVVLIGMAGMGSFVCVGVALAYARFADQMAPHPTLTLIGGAGVIALLATAAMLLMSVRHPRKFAQ